MNKHMRKRTVERFLRKFLSRSQSCKWAAYVP